MKKLLSLFAVALALTGCSPYTLVNNETYNNADLASYSTFRIITPEEGKMIPGMQSVTYYNIAAAIREQMVERGYTESPTSPLLINIGVSTHREITGIYREGVLTMDMVNIETKTPLYSASVATILNGNGMAQFRNLSGIAEAVKTLFSKFPVPLLPQYRNQK